MIAVMGAAGNVGSKVADLLLSQKQKIRVLEHQRALDELRRRGADVVTGEATALEDMKRLFDGAAAALVLLPDIVTEQEFVAKRSKMTHVIVDALREARVGHVVALSTIGAERPDAPGPPAGLHELEQRLSELDDANVLFLRAGFHMENLLASLPLIQSQGINGSAVKADLKIPMVATLDIAREAADRLARLDFEGHSVRTILGPRDESMREATSAIGSILGQQDLPYIEFPPDRVKGALIGAGMSEEAASLLVEMQLDMNTGGPFEGVKRTQEATTPTTLEAFFRQSLAPGEAQRAA